MHLTAKVKKHGQGYEITGESLGWSPRRIIMSATQDAQRRHSMMSTLKISGFEQMMSHPFHRPKNRHIIVEL